MRKKLITILKRILEIITALLAFSFVILGTILVYFYAKGYRFSLIGGNVRETGVLNLESSPSRADIYIKNVKTGKTPRTVASIDEGFVDVKLKKNGYYDWEKNIPVFREKSSSISADLFLKQAREEKIADIPNELSNLIVSKDNLHFIYTTKDSKNTISLWRYDLVRNFWDLSNNPHLISTIITTDSKTFRLYSSPNAQYMMVQYEVLDANKKKISKSTIFNTDQIDTKGTDVDLSKFKDIYNITWSNSEGYIMLESNTDIISFNITTLAKYLVYKKASKEKLIWSTDSANNMYYLSNSSDNAGPYQSLEQINLDGTNNKTLIPRIYSQSSQTYLDSLKSSALDYVPFTNSPISTKFVGKIQYIYIDQATRGIFISTDKASYWYETEIDKYVLIHTAPTEMLAVSENKRALVFKDATNGDIYVYTFDKEKNDPVAQIGTQMIIKKDEGENTVTKILWLDNQHLLYSSNNFLYIVDKDGDNLIEVSAKTSPLLFSGSSGKYVHTIELNNQKNQIIKYTLQ